VAVEEDQQRLVLGMPDVGGGDDDLDVLIGADVVAVDREGDDLGSVPVGGGEDGRPEHQVDDGCQQTDNRQRAQATAPDLVAVGRTRSRDAASLGEESEEFPSDAFGLVAGAAGSGAWRLRLRA
jgi:hypothetical protein